MWHFAPSMSLGPVLCCPQEMTTLVPEATSLNESIWRGVEGGSGVSLLIMSIRC